MEETKVKVEAGIINGKFCRNRNDFCRFFWEDEAGQYGCALLGETEDLPEDDTSQMPKFKDCPNPS